MHFGFKPLDFSFWLHSGPVDACVARAPKWAKLSLSHVRAAQGLGTAWARCVCPSLPSDECDSSRFVSVGAFPSHEPSATGSASGNEICIDMWFSIAFCANVGHRYWQQHAPGMQIWKSWHAGWQAWESARFIIQKRKVCSRKTLRKAATATTKCGNHGVLFQKSVFFKIFQM